MSQRSSFFRVMLLALFVLLLGAGAAMFFWRQHACTKEVLKVTEIPGIRFVVEWSSCDLLAKDESISIYATKTPESAFSKAVNRLRRPVPLFRYDPGSEDNPLPSITMPNPDQIQITLASVSSIASQDRIWQGKSISYDIRKIYYQTGAK